MQILYGTVKIMVIDFGGLLYVGPTMVLSTVLLVGYADGAQTTETRYEQTQTHMGTLFRIVVYGDNPAIASRSMAAAFNRVAALEKIFSDYRDDSELSRLCEVAGQGPTSVSPELYDILCRAREIHAVSGGAFDVTVGPIVRQWRRARLQKKLPTPENLGRAKSLTSMDAIELTAETRSVRLAKPGMKLDLGGIAKGYACQAALAELTRVGLSRAMVVGGGDVVVGDPPPNERYWKVAIADPARAQIPLVHQPPTVFLTRAAVSTSGDAEQFVEIDGVRYSHLVDPQTGIGLTHRIQATVIARTGTDSDSLASAVCVLGVERGLAMIEKKPDTAVWIAHYEGGEARTAQSKNWASLANQEPTP